MRWCTFISLNMFVEDVPVVNMFKCLILFSTATLSAACSDGTYVIPQLYRRARDYDISDNETYVSDANLPQGWYSTGQYMMPDSNTLPPLGSCGTYQPIYLDGIHPRYITETPINVTVCTRTHSDDCYPAYHIWIRQCDDNLQYYLKPTEIYSAYCFDPPEIQNATNSSTGPTEFAPVTVSVLPELQWTTEERSNTTIHEPSLVFKCYFTPTDDDLWYTISWFVNGQLILVFPPEPVTEQESSHLTSAELVLRGFHMGVNLVCGVQVSVDETGTTSEIYYSNEFYAGIKVLNKVVTLNLVFTPEAEVLLQSTIPIGCTYIDGEDSVCSHTQFGIQISDPGFNETGKENGGGLIFGRCNMGIDLQTRSSTWDSSVVYKFKVNSAFTTIDISQYTILLETDPGFGDQFYAGQPVNNISVTVYKGVSNLGPCYSHIDPHMRTFDGYMYENQRAGQYVLYRNTKHDIEVQEETKRCNSVAVCTCRVAIRAGQDVFMVSRCHANLNEFVVCNDGGLLDVEKINEFKYKIYTPIGSVVVIHIIRYNGYFMNVDIYASPMDKGNTDGLCGLFDGDSRNDFTKRDGQLDLSANRDYTFSTDWIVRSSENLFISGTYSNLQKWSPTSTSTTVCVCPQGRVFLNETRDADDVNQAFCGGSQFVGRFKAKSVTDKKCLKVSESEQSSNTQHNSRLDTLLSGNKPESTVNDNDTGPGPNSNITEAEAEEYCTIYISQSMAVTEFGDRLGGQDVIDVIWQCTFDVYASQDYKFGAIHTESLISVVKELIAFEPAFAANNTDKIMNFLRQSCSNNCSNNGICSDEGKCICDDTYFGPDCSQNDEDPVHVDSLMNDGLCDTSTGDDCRCFWFYTENLRDNFICKFTHILINLFGIELLLEDQIVVGVFDDMFTGMCCLTETTLAVKYDVSISNNGATFGTGTSLFIFDGSCFNVTTNGSSEEQDIEMKTDVCVIDGLCLASSQQMPSDPCFICNPAHDQLTWHNVCEFQPSDQSSYTTIIAVTVSIGLTCLLSIVVGVLCCHYKSSRENRIIATDLPEPKKTVDNARVYLNKRDHFATNSVHCLYDEKGTLAHSDDDESLFGLDDRDDTAATRPASASTVRGININVEPAYNKAV